jgi:RNA polymerase sigma-70 factor (ECF subfamily)
LLVEPVIRSVVARFARDQATAEELRQACRIRILEKREQCRDPEAVFGWAKRLCHRVCVTAAENERRDRDRFVQDEDGIASAETTVPDPLAAAENSEMQLRVRSAVERLPPDQRRLLILRYWEGLTAVDIAHRLGMPAPTVRTRLRRTCLSLKHAREIVCYAPRRPSLWSRRRENDRMDVPRNPSSSKRERGAL